MGAVIKLMILIPLTIFYWESLLSSVEDSLYKAILITSFIYVAILVDLNQLSTGGHIDDHHD